MKNSIGSFHKSHHFSYRQWDRKISDSILLKVLKNIKPNKNNTILIVSRKALLKLNKNSNKELFIKVDKETLITCFYCEIQEYKPKKRNQNYLIISKI